MRKTILLVIMTTAIIFSACTGRQAKEKEKALDTIPMMVMQIQKCSRLYTAEAQVHRIITHDDQLRLKGSILKNEFDISLPGGKRKVAIPMDATLKAYIDFKSRLANKMLIFVSHADGKQPEGRAAKAVKYDAMQKIWVEGFVAFTNGRFIGPTGQAVIWRQGAWEYWNKRIKDNNSNFYYDGNESEQDTGEEE